MTRADVLQQVADERERQDAKWGEQNHPDVDPHVVYSAPEVRLYRVLKHLGIPGPLPAKLLCDRFFKIDRANWAAILVEEVSEVVEAAVEALCTDDWGPLRGELVQVAAVCVNWIEAIDRRGQQ